MKFVRILTAALVAFGAFGSASVAEASFIGDTVGCNITGGGSFSCNNPTAVVTDPGLEFYVGGGNFIGVDIGATTITLDFLQGGSLGATIINLTDMNWFGLPGVQLTGLTLTTNSGVNGLDQTDLSFGANSVTINLIDTDFSAGASAFITVTTDASPIPEPSTWLLFGSALTFVGLRRRRKA